MSDGVWKFAGWETIRRLAPTAAGPEWIETLQGAARLRGSGAFPDDFTVVLAEAPD